MKRISPLLFVSFIMSGCNGQNNVDYIKPREEHVEVFKNDSLIEENHTFYTYDGDSLTKVVYYENDSLKKKIYEFVWENKQTKCVYITENGERQKVKEQIYNKKGRLLESVVFKTFKYDFGNYSVGAWMNLLDIERESKLTFKYNDEGLCIEKYNNFQPGWTNVEKYTYNGKTKITLYERYHNNIRIDTNDFFLLGKEEVFYDNNFKKLKSTKDLHKDPKENTDWEEYEYYPNDSLKVLRNYKNGKLSFTSNYVYDKNWRLVSNGSERYDYENFTKTWHGVTIKYLDEKFDKIVSYSMLGMKVNNTYDEYRRPLTESLENGTYTEPDFDATYIYDGNVTYILRHDRDLLDEKGQKSLTKKIKIIY